MFALEEIVRRNNAPGLTNRSGNVHLWKAVDLGGGHVWITGPTGFIHVDASNPQDDRSIVKFNQRADVPSAIAYRVEQIASQHRRVPMQSGPEPLRKAAA